MSSATSPDDTQVPQSKRTRDDSQGPQSKRRRCSNHQGTLDNVQNSLRETKNKQGRLRYALLSEEAKNQKCEYQRGLRAKKKDETAAAIHGGATSPDDTQVPQSKRTVDDSQGPQSKRKRYLNRQGTLDNVQNSLRETKNKRARLRYALLSEEAKNQKREYQRGLRAKKRAETAAAIHGGAIALDSTQPYIYHTNISDLI
ncbi:hypothetical protein BS78_K233800 [Paspalum vaginatum]|uniref:Uncharacterized protein n=1 Tax=Paspalum vaginatum TaxID=158149 RepID=A0A9W8CG91_9POAL|nr:hypothetical protein BS78_K233800 [Paspalum vaginatum]